MLKELGTQKCANDLHMYSFLILREILKQLGTKKCEKYANIISSHVLFVTVQRHRHSVTNVRTNGQTGVGSRDAYNASKTEMFKLFPIKLQSWLNCGIVPALLCKELFWQHLMVRHSPMRQLIQPFVSCNYSTAEIVFTTAAACFRILIVWGSICEDATHFEKRWSPFIYTTA